MLSCLTVQSLQFAGGLEQELLTGIRSVQLTPPLPGNRSGRKSGRSRISAGQPGERAGRRGRVSQRVSRGRAQPVRALLKVDGEELAAGGRGARRGRRRDAARGRKGQSFSARRICKERER